MGVDWDSTLMQEWREAEQKLHLYWCWLEQAKKGNAAPDIIEGFRALVIEQTDQRDYIRDMATEQEAA